MTKLNVVSLEDFKEKKEIMSALESYKHYLKTLGNSQLEIEINHLLDEFSNDVYNKYFFSKGQLILKEISSRAEGSTRAKIEDLTKDPLRLL